MKTPTDEQEPDTPKGKASLLMRKTSFTRGKTSILKTRKTISWGTTSVSRSKTKVSRGETGLAVGTTTLSHGDTTSSLSKATISKGEKSVTVVKTSDVQDHLTVGLGVWAPASPAALCWWVSVREAGRRVGGLPSTGQMVPLATKGAICP
ncbi:zwilling isoform X2 [Alosa sapidissima]|uniref:zwilling isoform X2 n=1 Tax=Alosa sapidissima TaxID=34773 RepID=UPI001C09441D|nr:zwilling isoform X2 [Alosa sapidissima]